MFLRAHINYANIIPNSRLRLVADGRHYIVQDATGAIDIRLRKRTAYPATYCDEHADGTFSLGYGPQHSNGGEASPEEHLFISIDAQGKLMLKRDTFVTLPIFLARIDDMLVIDNSYENILSSLPRATISTSHLLDSLAQGSIHLNDTLVREITLINEREICQSDMAETRIIFPISRDWGISREAPITDVGEYPSVLSSCLAYFADSRLKGANFAYHASGGLDSATLPFFLSKKYGIKAPLATVWYPGAQGRTQKSKIQRLMARAGSIHVATAIDSAVDFPLAHQILPGDFSPFYLHDEIYVRPNERLAEQLQAMGITVLCTGLGGR